MCIDTFTRWLLILILILIVVIIISILIVITIIIISINTIITQLQEHEDKVPIGFCLGRIHRRWQNCSDCHHH